MGPWLVAWLVSAQAAPVGFAGVEWRPLSRQDLVWVDENRTSGTAVGEFDGVVKPVLSAFGGAWFNRYVGLSAGLGVAQSVSDSATEDSKQQHSWSVVRPSLDVRLGWMVPRERFPVPWFLIGVYGDIPTVVDRSLQYTEEEQAAADSSAQSDKYRLGGVGGRAGAGVDYRVLPYLAIGAQFDVGLHRATYTGGDTRFTTLWVSTEASILLTFEWPGKGGFKRHKDAPTVLLRANLEGADGAAPADPAVVSSPDPAPPAAPEPAPEAAPSP